LRKSTNQWLFVAKEKQGLELRGLYFRRVPLKVLYLRCLPTKRKEVRINAWTCERGAGRQALKFDFNSWLKELNSDQQPTERDGREQVALLQLLRIDFGVLESDQGINNKESRSFIC
jgi:hypothetical protein